MAFDKKRIILNLQLGTVQESTVCHSGSAFLRHRFFKELSSSFSVIQVPYLFFEKQVIILK